MAMQTSIDVEKKNISCITNQDHYTVRFDMQLFFD